MMSSKKPFQNRFPGGNKLLSEKDIVDIERLITLLNDVIDYLINDGSKETCYTDLTKSLRILKNRETTGLSNVSKYIMSDFRMMIDRGQYGGEIDVITDEICQIIKLNPMFSRS